MKWLKRFAVVVLTLVFAVVVIRVLNPLPSLERRARSHALTDTRDSPLGQAVTAVRAGRGGLSGVHALSDASEALAARVSLARAATRSIDAQYYIWHQDYSGTILFNELRAAGERGVRVRLLLDDNNSSGLDPVIATLDAQPNIEVRLFNPFVIRSPRLIGFLTDFPRLNRRMHNKSFTADNQATIVGGRNIGDEYFGAGGGALFVDLDVLAVGPVVADVSRSFDSYWASASAFPADRIVPAIDRVQTDRIVVQLSAASRAALDPLLDRIVKQPLADQLRGGWFKLDWAPVRMISDDPSKGLGEAKQDDLLFSKLVASMGEPRSSLNLVSGYFVPSRTGTETLAAMATHGVKVTILTNALEATDVPIVHAGYAKWRGPLLRAGARLFELHGADAAGRPRSNVAGAGSAGSGFGSVGSALHAKTLIADDRLLFVGSFNFDPRSANLNTELGFIVESPILARRIDAALRQSAPERAYEVRLSVNGDLIWIERLRGREVQHATEPGTTLWTRTAVRLLSYLPIDWLL